MNKITAINPDPDQHDEIRLAFEAFHAENPHVYEWFDHFTREMIRKGCKRGSASLVAERIRWETTVETVGDPLKINNNYRCLYARLWMERNPEYEGFFKTRVRHGTTANSTPFPSP